MAKRITPEEEAEIKRGITEGIVKVIIQLIEDADLSINQVDEIIMAAENKLP